MSSRQRDTYEVLPAMAPFIALALVILLGHSLIQKQCSRAPLAQRIQ